MSIAEALVPEFDQEMATTRRVLERVPEDKFGWKPHDKSWTLAELAGHVGNIPGWTVLTMTTTEFDVSKASPEEMNDTPTSRANLLVAFDKNVAEARQALQKSDADYMVTWAFKDKGQTLFAMPRVVCVRTFCLNHLYHHRGQLSVYLRLTNTPVPSIYGPSADEAM